MALKPYIVANRNSLLVKGNRNEVFAKSLSIACKYGRVIGSDSLCGTIRLKTKLNVRYLRFPKVIKISIVAIDDEDMIMIRFGDKFDLEILDVMKTFSKEFFEKIETCRQRQEEINN